MSNNIQDYVVGLQQLSHFKAKQDLYNANTYQKKGETDLAGTVRYDAVQVLTDVEQAQARANIGAAAPGEGGGTAGGAVLYNAVQALDENDKARARANIGAGTGTWADMPDKPFGESGTNVAMPEDTSGLDVVSSQTIASAGNVAFTFYRVGDSLGSSPIGSTVSAEANGSPISFVIDSSHIQSIGCDGYAVVYKDVGFLPALIDVFSDNSTATFSTSELFGEDLTISVEKAGLYFFKIEGMGQTNSISAGIKKIDKKYLPDDIGVPDNVVTTDRNGLIPASVLPSYVDDVVEGYYNTDTTVPSEQFRDETNNFAIIPGMGKIYVDLNTSNTYRWSGSQYVQLNPPEITFATTSDIDELFN